MVGCWRTLEEEIEMHEAIGAAQQCIQTFANGVATASCASPSGERSDPICLRALAVSA